MIDMEEEDSYNPDWMKLKPICAAKNNVDSSSTVFAKKPRKNTAARPIRPPFATIKAPKCPPLKSKAPIKRPASAKKTMIRPPFAAKSVSLTRTPQTTWENGGSNHSSEPDDSDLPLLANANEDTHPASEENFDGDANVQMASNRLDDSFGGIDLPPIPSSSRTVYDSRISQVPCSGFDDEVEDGSDAGSETASLPCLHAFDEVEEGT